jgi:adenosylcobinamide hydrolase
MSLARSAPAELRPRLAAGGLVVDLGRPYRCLSSALLGGGLGWLRTWLNLQVGRDYARTDPEAHLAAAAAGLAGPVVGMMTAAPVSEHRLGRAGGASAVATVGVGRALAAAGTRPRAAPAAGTINLLVVVGAPLSDAGLTGAVQTAVEAKAQALAAARVPAANADGFATGTATDAICVACPPGAEVPFAGPATRVGGDLAHAVYQAVLAGALAGRQPAAASAVPGAG